MLIGSGQMAVGRAEVRLAALRELLRSSLNDDTLDELDATEAQAASLLLAGYGERDLCAALNLEADRVQGILMRLAR